MKTLNNTMSPLTPNGLDMSSITLCSVTVGLKMLTVILSITSLSAVATVFAILAGASTLLYNIIKIRNEVKNKK